MVNEIEQTEGVEDEVVEEIVETKDEFDNDTTDWKALALEKQGRLKRYQTRELKAKEKAIEETEKEAKAKEPEKSQDKTGLGYAEKAFLKASGIKSDEFSFVEEAMESTGKSLDEILEAKWFQAELKEKRELSASADAVPESTTRGGGAARTKVEYWIDKVDKDGNFELPPADQVQLRRDVVNARMKRNEQGKFTDHPVA